VKTLTDKVYLLEGLKGANSYLLDSSDELTLIDTGSAGDAGVIRDQIQQAGFSLNRLKLIILTHCHADHAGGAARLQAWSQARIAAHAAETAYLEGQQPLPFKSSWKKVFFWISDRILFPQPPLEVARVLEEGDQVPVLDGLQVIHTPGHTPGSISLFQPARRILFCGDALFLAHPLTGSRGLRLPLKSVSVNTDLAQRSAHKIQGLQPEMLLPGHGRPLIREAAEQIASLLKEKR
jgi:glyoxylase-like metal-dependent hydrolase (beta-lactamase superfamily II)